MDHTATGSREAAAVLLPEARDSEPSGPRFLPLAEARGVLRDALAALRNLEHLLRSPKVGPRALSQLIPGLRELCDPFEASVQEILLHIAVTAAAGPAARALFDYTAIACARLRQALDHASAFPAMMGAKPRLAFEAQVQQAGADLNAVRRLMDLLSCATDPSETELDIEEVVSESFVASGAEPIQPRAVTVVTSFSQETQGFHASPQVVVPLIALGVAVVHKGPGDRIAVQGICREGAPVLITVSRARGDETALERRTGDVHLFTPPVLIPPTLTCAQAAACLAGGSFDVTRDVVTITWRPS